MLNRDDAVEGEGAELENEKSMDAEFGEAGRGPERWNPKTLDRHVRIAEIENDQITGGRLQEMGDSNAQMEIAIAKHSGAEGHGVEDCMGGSHHETGAREYCIGNSAMHLTSSSTLERVMAERQDRLGLRNDPLNWSRRRPPGAVSATKEKANTVVDKRPSRMREQQSVEIKIVGHHLYINPIGISCSGSWRKICTPSIYTPSIWA
jgi:hypothetical protein